MRQCQCTQGNQRTKVSDVWFGQTTSKPLKPVSSVTSELFPHENQDLVPLKLS